MFNFLSRPFMKLKRELELKTSTSPKWMPDVVDSPGGGVGVYETSSNGYLNVVQNSQRSSKSSTDSSPRRSGGKKGGSQQDREPQQQPPPPPQQQQQLQDARRLLASDSRLNELGYRGSFPSVSSAPSGSSKASPAVLSSSTAQTGPAIVGGFAAAAGPTSASNAAADGATSAASAAAAAAIMSQSMVTFRLRQDDVFGAGSGGGGGGGIGGLDTACLLRDTATLLHDMEARLARSALDIPYADDEESAAAAAAAAAASIDDEMMSSDDSDEAVSAQQPFRLHPHHQHQHQYHPLYQYPQQQQQLQQQQQQQHPGVKKRGSLPSSVIDALAEECANSYDTVPPPRGGGIRSRLSALRGSSSGLVSGQPQQQQQHQQQQQQQNQRGRSCSGGCGSPGEPVRFEYGRHSLKACQLPNQASRLPASCYSQQQQQQQQLIQQQQLMLLQRGKHQQRQHAHEARSVGGCGSTRPLSLHEASILYQQQGASSEDLVARQLTHQARFGSGSELSRDLERLTKHDDYGTFSGRRSAFSPVHCCHSPSAATLGNHRSRSAAVLASSSLCSASAAAAAAAAADSESAYDSVLAASLLQMSCKLRRCSDELLAKLRRSRHLSRTPSPAEELALLQQRSPDRQQQQQQQQQQQRSQMQDTLHSCLHNLQAVQYQLSIIERAVFPQAKSGRSSALGSCSEGEYLMERDRINSELRGFQPIDPPPTGRVAK